MALSPGLYPYRALAAVLGVPAETVVVAPGTGAPGAGLFSQDPALQETGSQTSGTSLESSLTLEAEDLPDIGLGHFQIHSTQPDPNGFVSPRIQGFQPGGYDPAKAKREEAKDTRTGPTEILGRDDPRIIRMEVQGITTDIQPQVKAVSSERTGSELGTAAVHTIFTRLQGQELKRTHTAPGWVFVPTRRSDILRAREANGMAEIRKAILKDNRSPGEHLAPVSETSKGSLVDAKRLLDRETRGWKKYLGDQRGFFSPGAAIGLLGAAALITAPLLSAYLGLIPVAYLLPLAYSAGAFAGGLGAIGLAFRLDDWFDSDLTVIPAVVLLFGGLAAVLVGGAAFAGLELQVLSLLAKALLGAVSGAAASSILAPAAASALLGVLGLVLVGDKFTNPKTHRAVRWFLSLPVAVLGPLVGAWIWLAVPGWVGMLEGGTLALSSAGWALFSLLYYPDPYRIRPRDNHKDDSAKDMSLGFFVQALMTGVTLATLNAAIIPIMAILPILAGVLGTMGLLMTAKARFYELRHALPWKRIPHGARLLDKGMGQVIHGGLGRHFLEDIGKGASSKDEALQTVRTAMDTNARYHRDLLRHDRYWDPDSSRAFENLVARIKEAADLHAATSEDKGAFLKKLDDMGAALTAFREGFDWKDTLGLISVPKEDVIRERYMQGIQKLIPDSAPPAPPAKPAGHTASLFGGSAGRVSLGLAVLLGATLPTVTFGFLGGIRASAELWLVADPLSALLSAIPLWIAYKMLQGARSLMNLKSSPDPGIVILRYASAFTLVFGAGAVVGATTTALGMFLGNALSPNLGGSVISLGYLALFAATTALLGRAGAGPASGPEGALGGKAK